MSLCALVVAIDSGTEEIEFGSTNMRDTNERIVEITRIRQCMGPEAGVVGTQYTTIL